MQYEDFPQTGLVLIHPSSPDYQSLITQIKARHSRTPVEGDLGFLRASPDNFDPPEDPSKSVVFFNKNQKSVALLQVLWCFDVPDGRQLVASCAWAGAESLLLPFGMTFEMRAAMKYGLAILPGSKRYITNAGQVIGDNSDVRPPSAQEIWKGGLVRGFGGGYIELKQPTPLRISIEGAFFEDGEFAGTNRTKLFEQVVAKANTHARIIELANQKGKSARSVLDGLQSSTRKVKSLTRPSLLPEANTPLSVYEHLAFRDLAENVKYQRTLSGDVATLERIRGWATTELPMFRKLAIAPSKTVV